MAVPVPVAVPVPALAPSISEASPGPRIASPHPVSTPRLAQLVSTWLLLLLASLGSLVRGAEAAPTGATAEASAEASARLVMLEIEGVINPLSADYLHRGLRRAADSGAHAILIRLDTPGGLDQSMRRMSQAILGSSVPVIVYVAPPGARAASAGMFITLSAHVAAMAPGTNIGAAHPVALGDDQRAAPADDKATNDAAALARSLANVHGRNAAWAERAVRESVSATAEEAVQLGVVDLQAAEPQELLRRLDGRQISTTAGEITLRTANAPVAAMPMTWIERLLHAIADPNIAFLLLNLGALGVALELMSPGAVIPGVAGVLALLLAFVALGMLPTNWAGVALIAIAVALVTADALVGGLGALSIGAVAVFILGSLFLFAPLDAPSPTMPAVRVHGGLIAAMAAALAAFGAIVLRAALRARRLPVVTGIEALVGRRAVAESDLSPEGLVDLDGERWRAVAHDGTVRAGEQVRVIRVEGVTLHVRPS